MTALPSFRGGPQAEPGIPIPAAVFMGSGFAAGAAPRTDDGSCYSTTAIISISTIASGCARPLIWIVVLVGLATPK